MVTQDPMPFTDEDRNGGFGFYSKDGGYLGDVPYTVPLLGERAFLEDFRSGDTQNLTNVCDASRVVQSLSSYSHNMGGNDNVYEITADKDNNNWPITDHILFEFPFQKRHVSVVYCHFAETEEAWGTGLALKHTNDNIVAGFGTANPQWVAFTKDAGWTEINSGYGYERWITAKMIIDHIQGEARFVFHDPTAGIVDGGSLAFSTPSYEQDRLVGKAVGGTSGSYSWKNDEHKCYFWLPELLVV